MKRQHRRSFAALSAVITSLLLTASSPSAGARDGEPTMLRLRSGGIQWGEIIEHTGDEFSFRRLDTGGVVHMAWSFMDPSQEHELRMKYGYIDTTSDVLYVDADRLILVDGKEITGVIVDRVDGNVRIKTEVGLIDVPASRLRAVTGGVQVPALEVYTKEELVQKRLADLPPKTAEALYEFGVFCEQVLSFQYALDAYVGAEALDPEFRVAEMPGLIVRTTKKVEQQSQLDELAEADHLKRRKRFDEALLLLSSFPEKFPESPLEIDRLKLTKRVEKAQTDYVTEVVQRGWYRWTERLAAKAAREMGYAQAVAYAEEKLHEEVLAALLADAQKWHAHIEEGTILQMWFERKTSRYRVSSYGSGTWLLGEDAALAGIQGVAQAQPGASEADSERAALDEKIRSFLQSQKRAGRSSALTSGDDEEDVEAFWKMLSSSSRSNWIVAYYAENSGDMLVKSPPELRNCSTCGGRGIIEVIISDPRGTSGSSGNGQESKGSGGLAKLACHACKGIGRTRRIRYK
jgi:hypothetical protein